MKLSVIIICGNEEKKIYDCLKSVDFADEIVVVDSESSDNTVEIAKKFTDKVFINHWPGYAKQKQFALDKANNEWVLSIDADERVSEELKKYLLSFNPQKFDGYFIKRDNYLIGKKINTCGWEKDYQLRFFKKSVTKMNNKLVHEGFEVNGEVGKIEQPIIHYTYDSISEALKKINTYTGLQAKEYYGKKKAGPISIFLHTISAFLRFFISYKGFKDGFRGLLISFFNSITTCLTYIKIWEMSRKN